MKHDQTSGTFSAVINNFRTQAQHCLTIGSPFYAEILPELAELVERDSAIGDVFNTWAGDPQHDAVALRFVAALNYLVITRQDAQLMAAFPPATTLIGKARKQVLANAILENEQLILEFLKSPPQTNEVGRSMALLGGFLEVADRFGSDMDIFEIGASAGLNLMFDQYHYQADQWCWGQPSSPVKFDLNWQGPPPPLHPINVHERSACDLCPIDAHEQEDRLLAYIWPDQIERVARIRGAINHAKKTTLSIDALEASQWLLQKNQQTSRVYLRVFYHSIIWPYFSQDQKQQFKQALQGLGAHATHQSPVIWLRLEPADSAKCAEVRMDIWPNHSTHLLAHSGYHGEWIKWLNN